MITNGKQRQKVKHFLCELNYQDSNKRKFDFIEMFQLICEEEITELEYHNFANIHENSLLIEHQWLLTS